jgi:aryl-alcohol dehydrogenase-like predicted oxidoreductase
MRKIELVKGIQSSVLGFGCAPVLGAVDAQTAKRAIETALACGINHFDLARSYGYGDAEKFVGKILKSRRYEVVIATKFGIKANWKAQVLSPVKPLVRTIIDSIRKESPAKTISNVNKGVNYADNFFDRIPLTTKEMEKSVEKSLRELKTDYIDYLFIHEPLQRISHIDELFELAARLKDKGTIRAFGLAYMRSQKPLHISYLDHFDILQFDNSPGVEGYQEIVADRGIKPNVFFSPLKGGAKDLSVEEKLKMLSADFPDSVILCSMFNQEHIMNNAKLFE